MVYVDEFTLKIDLEIGNGIVSSVFLVSHFLCKSPFQVSFSIKLSFPLSTYLSKPSKA